MSVVPSKIDTGQVSKEKTTILIADDHPLLRQALRHLLEKYEDFEIVAEAGDGEEAVKLTAELMPDVVIMDIAMPKLNGLEATRQIKAECPAVAVLVLTVHSDIEYILGILEAGAAAYLMKNVFGEEIINAIRSVVTGETILSPSVLKQILKCARRYPTKPFRLDAKEKLSTRELEILKLLSKGISNKDIAQFLNLSERTVKSYLVDIFAKLRVGSRTEAVIIGLRHGFLNMDDLE
jgi:DNA-binding NarL/FixJ family response regulator